MITNGGGNDTRVSAVGSGGFNSPDPMVDHYPDSDSPVEKRFLPAVALAVAEWFPILEGRALAVSEASITKENIPTLPLVMVAFARSTSEQSAHSRSEMFECQDAFVIEFLMKPERYKRRDGSDSPFWSYYDYEEIRDTLLEGFTEWMGPGDERVAYRGMTITADPLAVDLTFAFLATYTWCAKPKRRGIPYTITAKLCPPPSCIPEGFEPTKGDLKCQ